jgi:hypothetical protein
VQLESRMSTMEQKAVETDPKDRSPPENVHRVANLDIGEEQREPSEVLKSSPSADKPPHPPSPHGTADRKRMASRLIEQARLLRTRGSGMHKVRGEAPPISSGPLGERASGLEPQPSLQECQTAPEQGLAQHAAELRSYNSAPEGSQALAAIRSLQTGNSRIDRGLRNKIAAAAKRVLESRQRKRRAGAVVARSRAEVKATAAITTAAQAESAAPSQSQIWEAGSLALAEPSWPGISVPPVTGSSPGVLLPRSLPTAAALAQGSPVQAPSLATPAVGDHRKVTEGGSMYPRPAESMALVAQPGGAPRVPHTAFTVTTGVPRFAQGGHPSKP